MLIAGGAGTGLAAGGKIMQGQQQQQAYDYNASVALINGKNQAVSTEQSFAARVGEQASAYASSGVDITSGSPLLIMAATAARGSAQSEQIMQAADEQAALDRYYGKVAAFSGTMSGIGAFLNGISTDLSSYTKLTSNPTPTRNPTAPYGPNSD